MTKVKKRIKSFSLKEDNASKVEKIAYENKRKESDVVDEMIEEFTEVDNGS